MFSFSPLSEVLPVAIDTSVEALEVDAREDSTSLNVKLVVWRPKCYKVFNNKGISSFHGIPQLFILLPQLLYLQVALLSCTLIWQLLSSSPCPMNFWGFYLKWMPAITTSIYHIFSSYQRLAFYLILVQFKLKSSKVWTKQAIYECTLRLKISGVLVLGVKVPKTHKTEKNLKPTGSPLSR